MTRILLTGFEPFLGRSVNPSWEAVRQLDGEVIAGAWIRAVRVPVVYRESVRVITEELEREPVDALIIGGLAYGRQAVNVEALAHAVGDVPWSPDNAGLALANEHTDGDPSGPAALLATAPVRAITGALNEAGIPAVVSWDGGAYVSNATLYGALRYAQERVPALRATYLHVPALPEMTTGTSTPSMPLDMIVRAFHIACEVLATHSGPDSVSRRWPFAMRPLVG